MATSVCPRCGDPINEVALGDRRCQSCGETLPGEVSGPPASTAETLPGGEHVAEWDLLPKYPGEPSPPVSSWPDVRIRRSDHGETLAVFALLLPLLAQGVALALRSDSLGIQVALSWGTVVVTALLLAADAACLGSTDLRGTQRCSPVALFFGMFLLWIVCYPVAFFRRRHFGRPNLGPLAILVAACFVVAPFVQQFLAFGVVGEGPPTCTSREVTSMVDGMIRQSPLGPSVQSISGYRELRYDSMNQTRKGECQVKTDTETIIATYTVRMLNRATGTFQVEVDPIVPDDPPSCTDPGVIALLEGLVRDRFQGQVVGGVGSHQETGYDRANKIRHGRCLVNVQDQLDVRRPLVQPWRRNAPVAVNYKVRWTDQKTGQYQVEIEP